MYKADFCENPSVFTKANEPENNLPKISDEQPLPAAHLALPSKASYEPIAPPLWAYFRQLSMKEKYGVFTQVDEEVLFQISYRPDITTTHVIRYKGDLYDITRVDVFESYKEDLKVYCKRQLHFFCLFQILLTS